jgi:4-azaleucine resistance transporter AzlC
MPHTKTALAFKGAKDSFPLVVAAMPFGIVYGALGQSQGLSDWVVMAISIFVFAGASQFIAVTLLAAGAALPVIVSTVFIVNLRHSLYAVSLVPFIKHLSAKVRIAMGFGLTDETFAVVYNRLSNETEHKDITFYYLGSAGFMYLNWQICTLFGIVAGNTYPQLTEYGLDVAMVVAFIGIVVPHLKLPSHWICALVSTIAGILTYQWPHQTGLLFSSIMAIVVGVIAENILTKTSNDKKGSL